MFQRTNVLGFSLSEANGKMTQTIRMQDVAGLEINHGLLMIINTAAHYHYAYMYVVKAGQIYSSCLFLWLLKWFILTLAQMQLHDVKKCSVTVAGVMQQPVYNRAAVLVCRVHP